MIAWAQRWGPVVAVVSAAGQALAAVAAAIAIWFSWAQLLETQRGLMLTTSTIRASTAYQIQKDGRDLLGALVSEPEVFEALFSGNAAERNTQELTLMKARLRTLQVINFYASVYNQRDSGTVDDQLWVSVEKEFCAFINSEGTRAIWLEASKQGAYRPGFLKRGQECLKR
jgi:pantoate kinase